MQIVLTVGLSLLGIFFLFVLRKRPKETADYALMGIHLLLGGIMLSDSWVEQSLSASSYFVAQTLPAWLFPVFITYGLLVMQKPVPWYWLYSFALAFSLYALVDVCILSDYSPELVAERYAYPPLEYHIFFKTLPLFVIGVMIWFLRKLKIYREELKTGLSFIEPIRLPWLRHFALIIMGLYIFSVLAFISYNIGWIQHLDPVYDAIGLVSTLSVFYLSFHGIRQYSLTQFFAHLPEVVNVSPSHVPVKNQAASEVKASSTKYASSTLEPQDIDRYYRQLKGLFEQESVYTEPQLRIQQVARRMELTTHQLSQVINSRFGGTFYEFVNQYRVQALQEKLQLPANKAFTILALGFEVGFNSKASLNRIFKEQTGLTPSAFQKEALANRA